MEYEDIVRLQCFKDGKKLRVRIITPGYNSSANCLFPKAIRQEGKIYECPSSAVSFNRNANIRFFYRIAKDAIKIIEKLIDIPDDMTIYEIPECVICMDNISEVICVPCGHQLACMECYKRLPKKKCPLCRTDITDIATREQVEN
jgi:hypothetical protein